MNFCLSEGILYSIRGEKIIMQIFHNSQDLCYRTPFGAVPTGSTVTLRLRAEGDVLPNGVILRLFRDDEEIETEMIPEIKKEYEAVYAAEVDAGGTPCLLWYDFIIDYGDKKLYYSNSRGGLGGEGRVTDEPAANSYQITVYDKDFHTPEWFRERIMYQIFPDRFYSGQRGCDFQKKHEEYVLHHDWYEQLSFARHPYEDGPAYNDFYGGNLNGIKEKLPYLKSLGVGVIYLNPIFEAYSNHKYDTADYKTIDPMFGTEEDFSELCRAAEEMGIRIILDGVFSHTGADSIYFNKYGSYGENTGAYRDASSPYVNWYKFRDYPSDYESWWGCSNLPNVNEMEPSYLDYIIQADNSVVKKWIEQGAFGWRLDVADELPDEFIKLFRQELKKTSPDAVLIGEVWEDASNKIAYGKRREYLLGKELDSVMNYPFKDGVIAFIMNTEDAAELNRHIMSQTENYPTEALYTMMNIIGTHDTMRIKSLFGGMDRDCGTRRLSSGCEELAVHRVKLASLMQMTFYGVPCIYYGDEVGMEGGKDPFNRGTYPWRGIDPDLREWYQKLGKIRNSVMCLRRGFFRTVYAAGDVFVYERYFKDGRDVYGKIGDDSYALCAVNRSFEKKRIHVCLSSSAPNALNSVLNGGSVSVRNNEAYIELAPIGGELYV